MDFDKLNSLTKYPSILTYHALGEKGRIAADAAPQIPFEEGDDLIITEKVDGTNGRIVLLPDGDWFIGSREELLTARGDRIPNTTLRIVEALQPIAERTNQKWARFEWPLVLEHSATVIFAEVYGVKGAGTPKRYTRTGQLGMRVFDIAVAPLSMLDQDRAAIASWRDHGGQQFVTEFDLRLYVEMLKFELTPRLTSAVPLPTKPAEVLNWLEQFCASQCVLDEAFDQVAEGVVVRTADRSKIAKIRFDDYRRIS